MEGALRGIFLVAKFLKENPDYRPRKLTPEEQDEINPHKNPPSRKQKPEINTSSLKDKQSP